MSDLHIRIAWYDREFQYYSYGSWHPLESTNVPEYITWAKEENAKHPFVRYWVEAGEKKGKGRNIESHNLIRLEYESPSPTPIDTYVVIDMSGDCV